jgi:hypothetical protein
MKEEQHGKDKTASATDCIVIHTPIEKSFPANAPQLAMILHELIVRLGVTIPGNLVPADRRRIDGLLRQCNRRQFSTVTGRVSTYSDRDGEIEAGGIVLRVVPATAATNNAFRLKSFQGRSPTSPSGADQFHEATELTPSLAGSCLRASSS